MNALFGRLYAWTARRLKHPNAALRVFVDKDLEVEPAFVCGGRVFYRFKDWTKIPAHRAMAMQSAANEMRMNMTLDELSSFCKLVDGHLNGSVSRTELSKELFVVYDRLKWALEPYCLMKLAAATFFDEYDSPFMHTTVSERRKIDFWCRHAHEGFFLTWPLESWLNWEMDLRRSFLPYLSAAAEKSLSACDARITRLKDLGLNDHAKRLSYQAAALRELLRRIGGPLSSGAS